MSDDPKTKTGAGWAAERELVSVMFYLTEDERDDLKAAAKASEYRHVSPYVRSLVAAAVKRAKRKQVDETPPEISLEKS